jgi:outer membrane protein OmpA-like peptidoglycan-associated protein
MHILVAGFFLPLLLLGVSGCIATQDWVQSQMTPLSERMTEVEARLGQTEAQTADATKHIGAVEGQLGLTETKAALALKNLEHLRLEQSLALGVKEGVNFATDSASLTAETRRAIDRFLRTVTRTNDAIFLVAGHTDSTGSESHNYTLAQKRAANVARYLITQKGLDPLRVTVASYGDRMPLNNNATPQGRLKNRRVEILVYKEIITSAPGPQRIDLQRMSQQ